MKNLKKVGAVALAAVMAVTFAPVASLNVFAGTYNSSGVVIPATDTDPSIDAAGKYTLGDNNGSAATYTSVTVTANADGDVEIDLNGNTVNALVLTGASKANVTIKDTDGLDSADDSYATVKDITNPDKAKSLKIAGDLTVEEIGTTAVTVSSMTALAGADGAAAIKGTPAAIINSKAVVGNKAISVAAAGRDVSAISGAVVVDKLTDKKSATIHKDALSGTTVDVKGTVGNKSLTKVVTKYTYAYLDIASGTADIAAVSAANTLGSGTNTWTNTTFYAGATFAGMTNGDENVQATAPAADATNFATGDIGAASTSDIKKKNSNDIIYVSGIINYDRAITLIEGSKDKFGDSNVTPVAYEENTSMFEKSTGTGVTGITYYTEDPSKYLSDTTGNYGVALIDGSKYIIYELTHNKALAADAKVAQKSVEILRGSTWKKADGNKDVSSSATEEFTTGLDVSVKAPEDMSLVEVIEKTQTGRTTSTTRRVYPYGNGDNSKDYTVVTTGTGDFADMMDANVSQLIVDQVAKGKTLDIDKIPASLTTKKLISKPSDIGYYYVKDATTNHYYFGVTADVTDAFATAAAGKTTATGTINPTWTNETVFASKEISMTVSGVRPGVTLQGENGAYVTAVADDGTMTWIVNNGDVNTPVAASRFVNLKTNEHLYTIVPSEIAALKASSDWKLENADAFKVLPWNTTVDGAVKVVRFRSNTGEFLYSTDPTEQANLEKNSNWTREGVAFCGLAADKGYPVTRIVSTIGQGHAYCTSVENEVKPQVATGNWKQEGVPFWAVDIPANEKTKK